MAPCVLLVLVALTIPGLAPYANDIAAPLFLPSIHETPPAPLPTITIGNGAEYLPAHTGIPKTFPTLVGSELLFEIDPAGNGVFYLSSELRSQLLQDAQDACKSGGDQACQKAVETSLHQHSISPVNRDKIEPRNPVLYYFGSALAAAISFFIQHFFLAPPEIVIPAAQLHHVSHVAAISPSAVVVDGPLATTTLTQAVPALTATGVLPHVSILHKTSRGFPAGSNIITMPQSLADEVGKVLNPGNACPKFRREAVDLTNTNGLPNTYLFDGMVRLFDQMQAGGPLHDLVLIRGPVNPPLAAQDLLRVLNRAKQFARKNAAALGMVASDNIDRIANVVFTIVYESYVNCQIIGPVNTFPASATTSASRTTTSCPTGTTDYPLICQSPSCSGDPQKTHCAVGKHKGCRCTNEAPLPTPGVYNLALGNYQQKLFKSLNSVLLTQTPKPSCFVNSAVNFEGKPLASPSAWCDCVRPGNPFASVPVPDRSGIYYTIQKATGAARCSYSKLPSRTITVHKISVKLTTCRVESTVYPSKVPSALSYVYTTGVTYSSCLCNNGAIVGFSTRTVRDNTWKYCPHSTMAAGPPSKDKVVDTIQILDIVSRTSSDPFGRTIFTFKMFTKAPGYQKDMDYCEVTGPSWIKTKGVSPAPMNVGRYKGCTYNPEASSGGVLQCKGMKQIDCTATSSYPNGARHFTCLKSPDVNISGKAAAICHIRQSDFL